MNVFLASGHLSQSFRTFKDDSILFSDLLTFVLLFQRVPWPIEGISSAGAKQVDEELVVLTHLFHQRYFWTSGPKAAGGMENE